MSRGRKWLIAGAAAAVVALGGLALLGWYLSQDTAPPAVELADCEIDAGSSAGPAPSGEWVAVPGDTTFVGYRIEEAFGGDTFLREIGGRTPGVEASITLDGATVSAATVVADMTQLESDQARRDRFLESNGLETAEFPEATFTLTDPIVLSEVPPLGKVVSVQAPGDLELHGVTRTVTVDIEACWHGATAELTGSVPIVLEDYDIVPPDVPGLARSEPDGTMELQLTLEPATG